MNRKILISIFKQIVVDMAYEKHRTINSFAVVDNKIDLFAPAFGKSFKDYQEGKFYSTNWVNGGADKNSIQGQFPLLFIEQTTFELQCIDSDSMSLPFYLVVVDKLPCDTCEQIGSDEVLRNTSIMLRRVFKELITYRLYSTELVEDSSPLTLWATPGQIASLEAQTLIENSVYKGKDLRGLMIKDENIRVSQWGNFSNLRAHGAEISFNICDTDTGSFKYDKATVSQLAGTVCETC